MKTVKKKENSNNSAKSRPEEDYGAFAIQKYLELINWASASINDEPKDPQILLRALDGFCKQLHSKEIMGIEDEKSLLTRIIGLNQEKI